MEAVGDRLCISELPSIEIRLNDDIQDFCEMGGDLTMVILQGDVLTIQLITDDVINHHAEFSVTLLPSK